MFPVRYFRWLLILFYSHVFSQQTPCDPGLKASPVNPHAYRVQIGDSNRCEGLYISEDAGSGSILLVALLMGTPLLDPATGPIDAAWRGPQDAAIRLRSYSLQRTIHYRMDASLPRGPANYRWPMDMPKALGLKAGHFGLIAWISGMKVASSERDVYLPISLGGPDSRIVTASFWAAFAISKVALRIKPIQAAAPASPLLLEKPGQYPAGRRIDFTFPYPTTGGYYELAISAEDESSNLAGDSYVFYVK